MPKHIAILGSTGSIGTQTLDVARNNPDELTIEVLVITSYSIHYTKLYEVYLAQN